ncbi:MAG: zinc ribbon domain-containing protein [Oscillospiraceae bacterium]|nr:zinc ribbon domain-containing protein [Oscillospiraceae bacterium]
MICTNCGAEIPEGAKFCISCGTAAPAAPPVEQPVYEAPQAPAYEQPQAAPVYAAAAPQQPQYQQPQYAQPQYQQPQYAPQQPTYYAQPQPAAGVSGKSALTFGILGIVFACTFYLSFLGIIFSAIGLGKAKAFRAAAGQLYGPAKVGKILATIGLIVGIIMTVICLIVVIGLIAEYA